MITLTQALVVEGKYDRMKLAVLFDAPILETGGFSVFEDEEKQEMIRSFAMQGGIVILTDSDPAGRKIRSFVAEIARDGEVYHAFVPEITGKEHRKSSPGSAGILGVEGIPDDVLIQAVLAAVQPAEQAEDPVTYAEWYEAGLSGRQDSAKRREEFLRAQGLPGDLSQKQAIRYLNHVLGPERFRAQLLEYSHQAL